MQDRMIVNQDNRPIYDIVFRNSFDDLEPEIHKLNIRNKRLCIVTESTVGPLYAAQILEILRPLAKEVIIYEFPAGEENKNLDTCRKLYEKLIVHHFDRNDILIALGGGVVGDLTGYTAATYLRGIDFIQIPTTLLSQVDSSIGGKTGVDFDSYKNMVGAFHQPKLVYMNTETLSTLNTRQYLSGMGEVIKYGLIKDSEFFQWLMQNQAAIKNLEKDAIRHMLTVSCNTKRLVVENDFKEQGERALLNFGHTIGHAIEQRMDFQLLHGECVALGMLCAAYLSIKKGYLSHSEYDSIWSLLKDMNILYPYTIPAKDIVASTLNDKKMDSGVIKFILIQGIGNGVIDRSVSAEEMIESIEEVRAKLS